MHSARSAHRSPGAARAGDRHRRRADTDGQILVLYDVLDITAGRKPKFSKNFLAGHDSALEAVKAYTQAVKTREYPAPEHCF
jgi:3-methyl-2-oxobutanoate hydroxymethyltransferase